MHSASYSSPPHASLRRLSQLVLAGLTVVQTVVLGVGAGGVAHAASGIELTEFVPSYGGQAEVELKNTGSTPVDISGTTIAINGTSRLTIPAATMLAAGQSQAFAAGSAVASSATTTSLTVAVTDPTGVVQSLSLGLLGDLPAPDSSRAVAKIGGVYYANLLPTLNADNTTSGLTLPDQPASLMIGGDNAISSDEQSATPFQLTLASHAAGTEFAKSYLVQSGAVRDAATGLVTGSPASWTANTTDLTAGSATGRVYLESSSGVRSAILGQAVTVSTAPVIVPLAASISEPAVGNRAFTTVTYTVSRDAESAVLRFSTDGAFATGMHEESVPAGAGSHTVAPTGAGLTNGQRYAVRLVVSDASGQSVTANALGLFSYDPEVPAGSFSIRSTTTPVTDNVSLTTGQEVNLVIPASSLSDNVTATPFLKVEFSNDGQHFGSATDAHGNITDATPVLVANLPLGADGKYVVTSAGRRWFLTDGNGSKTISFHVIDEAGNRSPVVSQNIELDTRLTGLTGIVLPAGTTTTELHPFAASTDDIIVKSITTKSDSAVTLTASHYASNPYPTGVLPEGYTLVGPYFNLSVNPDKSLSYPTTFRVYFTQAELDGAGVTIGKMASAVFYDASSNHWKLYQGDEGRSIVVKSSDRAGFVGYVEVTANHLTPMALAAKTAAFAPAGLTVTPHNGQVTLKWDARSSATHYLVVYRRQGSTEATQVGTTGTEVTISGLGNGTTYEFFVYGLDDFGNQSALSATAAATPIAPVVKTASAPTRHFDRFGNLVDQNDNIIATVQSSTATTPAETSSPTPTPEVTASASSSPEETSTSSDRTPWIVLGVLVALAALATAGYFYWFRDEDDLPPTVPPTSGGSVAKTEVKKTNQGGVTTTVRGPSGQPEAPPPPPARPQTPSPEKPPTDKAPPPRW